MCLERISFKLDKQKNSEFVGNGFKYIKSTQLDKLGRLNIHTRHKKWFKSWTTANNEVIYCETTCDTYTSGFHIFLNENDARKYPSVFDGKIMVVQFKNVIAFGTNVLFGTNPRIFAPCVIANEMRIVQLI